MFGMFKNKPERENPSAKLTLFQSLHRIDDIYLADILGDKVASGDTKKELDLMCKIVESALPPLRVSAFRSSGAGNPHDEVLVAYLFGWLEIFKSQVWHVEDFNRSFLHYGFLLWFNKDEAEQSAGDRYERAIAAMLTFGAGIQAMTPSWKNAAQKGANDATAFLNGIKLPTGPALP